MICKSCLDVLEHRTGLLGEDSESLFFSHHATASSLRDSALQGCQICRTIWSNLTDAEQDVVINTTLDGPITHCLLQQNTKLAIPNSYDLAVMLNNEIDLSKLGRKKEQAFSAFLLQPSSDLKGCVGQPSGDSTASDEAWMVAIRWFNECTMNHPKCEQVRADREWFPTRLIDVGGPRTSDEIIQLVVTSTSLPTGPYVALSHCWGSATFLQLSRATLEDFQRAIPMSSLPQTFQDAIWVTRRLHVRYLWIDSLCIMQDKDDLSDWVYEAALMHKVYSNSLLNIAATGASDSSNGLFVQRDPQEFIPAEVNLPLQGLQPSAVPVKYQLTDISFWQKELSQAPLNRRAWVVQERLLAPRVLHFGRSQLMWECCEVDAAEIYPIRLPPALTVGALTRFKGLDPLEDGAKLRQRGPHDNNPRFFAHQLWHRIVTAYTRSLLTKSGDKLVALSGIAKRMSQVIQDEYVAGMWRFCLESQLLWYVEDCEQINREPSTRPATYRSPSFSWASVDGKISGGQLTDEGMLIEVVEINIEHETEDVTGLVKGGSIRLKGTLKLLKLTWDMFTETWIMTVNGTEVLPQVENEWERFGPLVFLDVNQPDFNGLNEREALFCMPARAPIGRWTLLVCLIFEKVGGQNGTFRRIGISMTKNKELVNMLLSTYENEASLLCEQYDEDSRRHTIRVI